MIAAKQGFDIDDQWHLRPPGVDGENVRHVGLNVEAAWKLMEGSRGHEDVRVAIVDTGVDISHPSFHETKNEKVKYIDVKAMRTFDHGASGQNGVQGQGNPAGRPIDAHGTALAGIIAAEYQATGVSGIAPGCTIIPIRLSITNRRRAYLDALTYLTGLAEEENSSPLIVLMAGYWLEIPEVQAAIEYLAQISVVIAPSGNKGTNYLDFPASVSGVIAVGACNDRGWRSTYSQYGAGLDVVAPSNDLPEETSDIVRQTAEEARDRAVKQLRRESAPGGFDPDTSSGRAVIAARVQQLEQLLHTQEHGTLSIATTDIKGPFGYNDDPEDDFVHAKGGYRFGGTSAAAAEVAGVVTLMLSARNREHDDAKGITSKVIRNILKSENVSGMKHLQPSPSKEQHEFGCGLVDCEKAVEAIMAI